MAEATAQEIDQLNIHQASLLAMQRSFEQLFSHMQLKAEHFVVQVDGKYLPTLPSNVNAEALIKGDSRCPLIGMASIIAKEFRDHLMDELGRVFPGYGLEQHAGYPTRQHKEALLQLGASAIHRRSFKGVKEVI